MYTEEDIKKYKICKTRTIYDKIYNLTTIKNLIKELNEFLIKYNIDDADINAEIDDHDGYFEGLELRKNNVPFTDKEIEDTINKIKEIEKWKIAEAYQNKKKRIASEKAEYQRLKKKYGDNK